MLQMIELAMKLGELKNEINAAKAREEEMLKKHQKEIEDLENENRDLRFQIIELKASKHLDNVFCT